MLAYDVAPPHLPTMNPPLYILSMKTASLGDSLSGPQRPKVNCMDWKTRSLLQIAQ